MSATMPIESNVAEFPPSAGCVPKGNRGEIHGFIGRLDCPRHLHGVSLGTFFTTGDEFFTTVGDNVPVKNDTR
jgi:hypothetical protein